METPEQYLTLPKVNNGDTRTTLGVALVSFFILNRFHTCYVVSSIEFEQVIAD